MDALVERLDLRGTRLAAGALAPRGAPAADAELVATVAEILADVRHGGDGALVRLTERFDGCHIPSVTVPPGDVARALDAIPPSLRGALDVAASQIRAFHEAQAAARPLVHEQRGVRIEELTRPVERAGCYVPGGRAAYPSTVLMTVLPARAAGVGEIVVCVPPGPDGTVPAATLAAAALAGADRVVRVGGAQAVAALAYGTESVPRVDVVAGPGNRYVTEAKRQVVGLVGIDSLAGPSDVVVVADATVPADVVATDLLAQAEHGPGGGAVLVTWDAGVADAVEAALGDLLAGADRRDDAASTLRTGGRIVLVEDAPAALDAANALAPEHLQLLCDGAPALVDLVRHAGAVFVGPWASAVVGDYVAGSSHVLPTGATARFSSVLRVDTFRTHVNVVSLDRAALAELAPAIEALATAEGLTAHWDAVARRLRPGGAR
jgi:histidinol dehydrogenase